MDRNYHTQWSSCLNREMHVLSYGWTGRPLIAFPCQDGMCDNWEGFQMPATLQGFIDSGEIQLFVVDTVDKESWSDVNGDKGHRAWIQECYYNYIINEALPMIRDINKTGMDPIVTGFSLGATHAAIVFLRRPDLFHGMISLSGCYNGAELFNGWCNDILYNNSPVHMIGGMPNDHWYINLYNEKKIVVCCGTGAWEDESIRTGNQLKGAFESKGIHAWVDFWGSDVNHDWPWWRKQIVYYLPKVLY